MEAERKAMPEEADMLPQEKITYKVGTKVCFPWLCILIVLWNCKVYVGFWECGNHRLKGFLRFFPGQVQRGQLDVRGHQIN